MEARIRPKSDYLLQASWEQLYAITRHCQSDLQFYRDEVRFFRHLTDNKILWLDEDKNIRNLTEVSNKLLGAEAGIKKLNEKIDKHLKHLTELVENPFSHDEHSAREEHSQMEDQFADFVKTFRELKRSIYSLLQLVAETERVVD